MRRLVLALIAAALGSVVAYAQIINPGGSGGGTPGGDSNSVQYNNAGNFGGIANGTIGLCLTYATPPIWASCAAGSQTSIAAGTNITTNGTAGNVTINVSPSGSTGQLQYNATGSLGAVTGASSNGANLSFTTNSLVINGQAIANVSGNTGTLATVSGTLGSGHCLQFDTFGNVVDSGTATCGGITGNTSIAAGSNITTSGTAGNVAVAVVSNPTFTSLTSTLAAFNVLTASGASLQTETIAGNLTGATASFSGNITGTTAQFSSLLTGTTVQVQTMTVGSLGASTQCLESIAGVITGFGSGCSTITANTGIAAGTNISTSGTAGNVTINVIATPTFTSVTSTLAGISGFLTATGASLGTATVTGALVGSTGNFSGNLTGTTAQFSGLLTGTTARFAGGLTGTYGDFANIALTSNLTGTTAQFSGLLTGTTGQFSGGLTSTYSGSGPLVLTGNLTGTTAQFSNALTGTTAQFQTVTVGSLGASTQCLESVAGVLTGFGSACGGTSATNIAAGTNITTSGTTANVTVNAVPSSGSGSGDLQYDNNGAFGPVSGATSNGTSVSFTTNSLALQGLTIRPSGTTGTLASVTGTLVSGNCLQSDAGHNLVDSGSTNCGGGGSPTSIAAGSNITTSGTASNVTVNVTPSPSFTNLTATGTAQFAGFLTAGGASLSGLTVQTATLSGNLTGTTANFSGNLTGTTASFNSIVNNTASSDFFINEGSAAGQSIKLQSNGSDVLNINNTGAVVIVSGSSNSDTAIARNAAGILEVDSGALGTLRDLVVRNLTATAGSTAASFVTASGAHFQTATIAGNLTGTTAQFSGAVTNTLGTVTTTNSIASSITANWSNATTTFVAPLFINIVTNTGVAGTTNGFGSGSMLLEAQSTGLRQFAVSPSGTIVSGNGVYTGVGSNNGSVHITTPSLVQFGDGADNANGWINWGGESRLSVAKTLFNSVALTPTALSVKFQGGRTYSVDADIYLNTAAGTSGIQVALTGTYGSTATEYFGYVQDGGTAVGTFGTLNPVRGAAISAAKNGVVGNTMLSGTTGYLKISGTITASSSGTLVVAAAQNTAASATQTTLARGSRLIVQDMP